MTFLHSFFYFTNTLNLINLLETSSKKFFRIKRAGTLKDLE
ncbi:hypothetical protein LEP1GSC170_0706 [Leptospira interrogans serovar Bataviae str. HAI135]|nr:hypothetical protein LEP1GSC170_0706 [Leptospira interrogans serovar Bataviae str. HAI135]